MHVGSVAGKGFRGPGHQSSSDAIPRAWMHALLRECLLPQHMGVVLKPPQHLTTKTRGWLESGACKLRGLWGISVRDDLVSPGITHSQLTSFCTMCLAWLGNNPSEDCREDGKQE